MPRGYLNVTYQNKTMFVRQSKCVYLSVTTLIGERMKLIFRTGDYSDFLVRRSLLEQAGLHVHSDNFDSYSAMPELGLSDGYRLWIVDEEYDEAVSLLTKVNEDCRVGEGQAGEGTGDFIACPKCGSAQTVLYGAFSFVPLLWFFGFLIPAPIGNRRVCRSCGEKFKVERAAINGALTAIISITILVSVAVAIAVYI